MKLLLVDGHYYAYRSFYAIRNLTNAKGEPVNALYGMAKALKRMIADLRPDRAAVVMDGGLPAARMEQQPDYKANRAETPDDLSRQFPLVAPLVEALGFTYLRVEGEEADDILASYARVAGRGGIETVLATNDKDLMQLVGSRDGAPVTVYQPDKEGFALIDPAAVEAKWGVPPAQIGAILALTGDAVDNIPGVPGFGPKTAAALLRQFGSLDALLAGLASVKSERQRQALEASRELIARNRIMVGLRDALPLPAPIDSLSLRPDPRRQVELFSALGFRTFLREAQEALGGGAGAGGASILPPPPPPALPVEPARLTQGELL